MPPANSTDQDSSIPTFYVDAAQVAAQPFTIQLVLGSADMNGRITPCVHLTLSPGFAAHLAQILRESVEQRMPPDGADAARTDPFTVER